MDAFVIHGGRPLRGTVGIHGSKNAALPLMAAALLTDRPVVLRGVPDLADIRNLGKLLGSLGCDVSRGPSSDDDPGDLTLHVTDPSNSVAPYEIVRTMRAGICVLGPMLAKRGTATVSMPGGCAIGDRPVDLHLRGLAQLGAEITLTSGDITAAAPRDTGRLKGAHVFLGGPNGSTVLGTANIMSAATLAQGTTIIEAAACEPEVVDLARLLNTMGAKITGAGSPRITVEGVDELGGATHTVIPDRIEAGTYVMAAAITNGDVTLERFPHGMLTAALDRLREVGVTVEAPDGGELPIDDTPATVRVVSDRRLRPTHVVTQPHPGFPTDLQAQLMALLTLAEGNSIITEKIFPERFLHVAELARMGASMIRQGPTVVVSGVPELVGAPVMASDLRASAGLVLAGLAATGQTVINRVYHLDRGYQRMERTLKALGADISRIDDRDL
ncbi:MAG: UDP-N-acetylglucosamine 1-carboxyvinyltransferase [Planctomycetota bacterium]